MSYPMLPMAVQPMGLMGGYVQPRGPSATTVILGLILLGVVGYLLYVFWLQPVPKRRVTYGPQRTQYGPQTVVPYVPQSHGSTMGPSGPSGPSEHRVAMPPTQQPPQAVKPVAVMTADSFMSLLGTMDPEDEGDSSKLSEDQIKALAAQRQAEIDRQNAEFQARAGAPAAAAS